MNYFVEFEYWCEPFASHSVVICLAESTIPCAVLFAGAFIRLICLICCCCCSHYGREFECEVSFGFEKFQLNWQLYIANAMMKIGFSVWQSVSETGPWYVMITYSKLNSSENAIGIGVWCGAALVSSEFCALVFVSICLKAETVGTLLFNAFGESIWCDCFRFSTI